MELKSVKAFYLYSILFIVFQNVYGVQDSVQNTNNSNDTQILLPTLQRYFYHVDETNKIAGGSYAKDGQFPFMVVVHRLLFYGVAAQCGGTVISSRWVLTAGHCIARYPMRIFVVFGVVSKAGIKYDHSVGPSVSMLASRVVVHSEYYHASNDIGLLYMPRDIPYTQKIQPIQLAGYNEISETFAEQTAYVIGWGRDRQASPGVKVLKYASLTVISNRECALHWDIDERNVCTANDFLQSACQGDSGGPLIVTRDNKPLQIGIVSYGDGRCPSGLPGVFTRVSTFAHWIETVTGIEF